MAAYTKTVWNSGAAPGIDAAELNNLETQHEKILELFELHGKAADSPAKNNNTLADDPDLQFAVVANEIWEFTLLIRIDSDATADFNYVFTLPAGAAIWGVTITALAAATTVFDADITGAVSVQCQATGTDDVVLIRGSIVIGGTAGDVILQWAQNVTNAYDTKVLKGSYLSAQKVIG